MAAAETGNDDKKREWSRREVILAILCAKIENRRKLTRTFKSFCVTSFLFFFENQSKWRAAFFHVLMLFIGSASAHFRQWWEIST
jgi:hypothetical protein